jgi:hypothetical protein
MASPNILHHLKNNLEEFDEAEDRALIQKSFKLHSVGYSVLGSFIMYGTFTAYRESKRYLQVYKSVPRANLYSNILFSVALSIYGAKS